MVVEGRIGHDKHPGTFENFRFLYTWLYSIKHQVSLAPVWTWTALLPCVLGGGTPLLLIITTLSIYTECGEMWLWSRTAAADGVLRAISCPLPLQVRCWRGEGGAWWRNNRDHYHWLHRVSSPAPQLSSGHKWRTVFCLYEPQPRLMSVWCR